MSSLSLQRIMISVSLGQQDHMKRILRHKEWAEQSVDFCFYDLTDLKQNPTKKSKWTQPISPSIVKCLNVHVKIEHTSIVTFNMDIKQVGIRELWLIYIESALLGDRDGEDVNATKLMNIPAQCLITWQITAVKKKKRKARCLWNKVKWNMGY